MRGEVFEQVLAPALVNRIKETNIVARMVGKKGVIIPTTVTIAANYNCVLHTAFDDGHDVFLGDVVRGSIDYRTGDVDLIMSFMPKGVSKAPILISFGYEL